MYSPNTTYRNVPPQSGSSYWRPQKGRDSLSLYLYLSRSGWFHDEVAKKLIKQKKKPLARSLFASLGYGCQLTFVAIVRLKGTCTSYRAGTTGPTSGSNEYGTTKVLRVRWERPRQARAGPCRAVPTDSTSAQSKHKVLAPRYISTSGSYYAIEPCTIHNFTLAHGS